MDITPEEYQVLARKPNMLPTCKQCTQKSVKDMQEGYSVEQKCEQYFSQLHDRMSSIERELKTKVDHSTMKETVKQTVDEVVIASVEEKIDTKVRSVVDEVVVAAVRDSIDSSVEEAVNERMLRQGKKENLMLFNIPESDCANAVDRKDEDSYQIFEILQNRLEIDLTNEEISPIRIGTKKDNSHRPVKVKINNRKTRMDILKNAHRLSTCTVEEADLEWIKNVHIAQDLTKQQRTEGKQLRQERDQRNQEAESQGESALIWVIRKSKVVQVPRRGVDRTPLDVDEGVEEETG
jgi:hypothetical protein